MRQHEIARLDVGSSRPETIGTTGSLARQSSIASKHAAAARAAAAATSAI
jgi:hypothetical protein